MSQGAASKVSDASDDDVEAITRPKAAIDRARDRYFPHADYHLARFAMLRLLGVVYLAAFVALLRQGPALFGARGLTPASSFLERLASHGEGFRQLPTIFWWDVSDGAIQLAASLGIALSLLVVAGFANAPILTVLFVLYGSFVRIGQVWYGYGWELQLIETGFLAIFLAQPLDPRPLPPRPVPFVVVVLFRWLVFRVFLGAGLIKLRGDPCWIDATCLDAHFETQPVPNPLSPFFHAAPHAMHALGVVVNHAVELVLPFFVFGPVRARRIAGVAMIGFQVALILSGNLAFLNWLTIVPVFACLDDAFLERWLPTRLRAAWSRRAFEPLASGPRRALCAALAALVAVLSIDPALNLLSDRQAMNRAYTTLELVNSYGAFGVVGSARRELVFEGTRGDPSSPDARWVAYEFPCKPGDPRRRLCVLGPYHHRLDWQVWFAAMGPPGEAPWALHLVAKLLRGERVTRSLFANDPFPDAPPRAVRVRRYVYRFAPIGSDATWLREPDGLWLPPLDRHDPRLLDYLRTQGFDRDP